MDFNSKLLHCRINAQCQTRDLKVRLLKASMAEKVEPRLQEVRFLKDQDLLKVMPRVAKDHLLLRLKFNDEGTFFKLKIVSFKLFFIILCFFNFMFVLVRIKNR